MLVASAVCSLMNVRFAYRVTYNKETVGYVATADQLSEVESEVISRIKTDRPENYLGTTAVKLSLTFGGNIASSRSVASNILEGDSRLVPVTVLTIDGESVCAVTNGKDTVEAAVDAYLGAYSSNVEDKVEFLKDVKVEEGYYPSNLTDTIDDVLTELAAVDVQTVKTLTYTEDIPFETVQTKSNSYLKGYRKVTSKGVKGSQSVTAVVTYVNGAETAREVVNTVTLSDPVAQQEIIGTAAVTKVTGAKKASGNAMFIWPLKKVSGQYISSYYGDGRNHRALDIASDSGTPIYAGLGGTVTTACYKSDYGYHVVIDHGNGYKTLYAHASKLYVNVGDVVETGETIALVGSTGQSTGSHLHFEVIINGNRVDPLGYINK